MGSTHFMDKKTRFRDWMIPSEGGRAMMGIHASRIPKAVVSSPQRYTNRNWQRQEHKSYQPLPETHEGLTPCQASCRALCRNFLFLFPATVSWYKCCHCPPSYRQGNELREFEYFILACPSTKGRVGPWTQVLPIPKAVLLANPLFVHCSLSF